MKTYTQHTTNAILLCGQFTGTGLRCFNHIKQGRLMEARKAAKQSEKMANELVKQIDMAMLTRP